MWRFMSALMKRWGTKQKREGGGGEKILCDRHLLRKKRLDTRQCEGVPMQDMGKGQEEKSRGQEANLMGGGHLRGPTRSTMASWKKFRNPVFNKERSCESKKKKRVKQQKNLD